MTALDKPTGQTDDSFGQGTKEDTAVSTVVDGSIPNNKSDLTRLYVANERVSGKEFLYLAWERVQEPTGTTNMDFEFNQSGTVSANGVTPVRTAGDVLIKYDLSQGGVNPVLGYHLWTTTGNAATVCEASNSLPCWDKVHALSGANFEGSINAVPVTDPIAPNAPRKLSTRTFGEAAINLTDSGILPAGTCKAFGAAYLKSRSSDSFTAALKDFIAPKPVSISNCGKIVIQKVTAPSPDPTNTAFSFALTGGPSALNKSFSLKNGESNTTTNVQAGSGYTAAETVPANWSLTSATCDDGSPVTNIDVSADETVTCTFTNTLQLGAIKVTKTRKHAADGAGDHPHAGVNFTVNGVTKATDSAGVACFDGLTFGSYTVHETVPAGYHVDANDKSVTVDNTATCGATPYAGESVSFHNTPLTDLTVSVDSQVAGGTASTIDCGVASGSTGAGGDGSVTAKDLEPGTYTCVIVVDP
ncbi:prealbumin-like fold domain-containing protein [Amycolatopsis tolypomycina]|uniref:prealbumin-like fold domain-containing protein n=1 Tax=Amycolatopsis tolypomycina TaxID=208445 RepID=UPI0033A68DB4